MSSAPTQIMSRGSMNQGGTDSYSKKTKKKMEMSLSLKITRV